MKKKKIKRIVIILLCLSVGLGTIGYIVLDSLSFSENDYIVYVPDGAPENVWIEKDVYYVTSQMSFEYANEFLLQEDYEQFKDVFISSYNKFSDEKDVYYSIRKVFLKDENQYNRTQETALLTILEDLYQEEIKKENNQFLTEKNIMLQIELNCSFGNYIHALELDDLIEE